VTGWRFTRDGWVVLGGAALLTFVGFWSANNLLLLVASPLAALAGLSVPLGWANLRGLRIARGLPSELYAGREAGGRLVLENPRRTTAHALSIADEGTTARAEVERIGGRATLTVRARWRFAERGAVDLASIEVRSLWPFGLTEHTRRWDAPAQLVVYARPLPSSVEARHWSGAVGAEPDEAGHGTGDFLGLRPYREGDPPRRVHWPTSARVGAPMVAERAGETEASVEVVVHPRTSARWERELSVATGEVLRAVQLGRKVGLVLPPIGERPGRRMEPGSGEAWRRALLESIALLPRIP
jgi:uncharacterized protein (DUF58 family)